MSRWCNIYYTPPPPPCNITFIFNGHPRSSPVTKPPLHWGYGMYNYTLYSSLSVLVQEIPVSHQDDAQSHDVIITFLNTKRIIQMFWTHRRVILFYFWRHKREEYIDAYSNTYWQFCALHLPVSHNTPKTWQLTNATDIERIMIYLEKSGDRIISVFRYWTYTDSRPLNMTAL